MSDDAETFGRWRLDALIAVGGLGEVWRARSIEDAEVVVALKRLHAHLLRHEEARAMFEREQQLAVALPRHPNLVHAVAAGAVDGRPFVALELARGGDLRDAAKAPMPRQRAIEIVARASGAAAHLHAHKHVHGDINLSNVIVSGDGDAPAVVLVDLGVARKVGEGGPVRGTHAYMAPEQVRGEAWTPATDVFALGVLLWELAAGARLFHRGPPWLSAAAVVEADVPPLADRELDAIARAALVKDPTRRTQTAAELAAQLRALL